MAAVLGFARRLDRTFDNKTPITDFNSKQTVQLDADRAVGYLDPVDPDRDRLTYTAATIKGGTVTFDQTTPGKFTYTAPDMPRDETVPWTDTVTITTSDAQSGPHIHGLRGLFAPSVGHTTTQTVSITLKPVTAPDVATDGTVSGRVPADNTTLKYTTGGDLSSAVGTVEVHDDGTWTFSPTAAARYNAANGGAQLVSFTLVARDGEHQTPIRVSAPIAPATDTSIPVQPGTSPTGNVATGSDGSIVQASTDGDNTYITVIDRNGIAHISQPLAGAPVGDVVAARGNAYQATYDGTNTHVNIVLPDGSVKTAVVQGQTTGTIVVGQDGEAYITSTVTPPATQVARQGFARMAFAMQTMAIGPLNPDTGGATSNVTVLGVDGTWFAVTDVPGVKSGDVVIADDGYAYQTTYRSHAGVYETYVTVIDKDTQTSETTNPVDGEPRQLIVASDAVYQLVHQDGVDTDGDGINDVADKTTVNAISHEASITQYEIAGDTIASDIVADGNGRVYLTTSATLLDGSRRSYIMTLDPGGVVQTAEMPGDYDYRQIILDDDGYAYLASYENTDDTGAYGEHTYVTVIAPGGDIPGPNDAVALLGTPRDGVFVGRDGKTYITTSDGATVKVNAINQDGTFDEVASLSGSTQEHALVGVDGTVFVTTFVWSPDGDTKYFANVVEPGGRRAHRSAARCGPRPQSGDGPERCRLSTHLRPGHRQHLRRGGSCRRHRAGNSGDTGAGVHSAGRRAGWHGLSDVVFLYRRQYVRFGHRKQRRRSDQ